jgi:hypothetical protein
MANSKSTLMLHDFSLELLSKAKATKLRAKQSGQDFDKGYHMAFYEVLSLLAQQIDAFGIEREDVGLVDFEPERDLL